MVEVVCNFPFRSLRYETYLVLDVLMYIDYHQALYFMFSLTKESRAFLQSNSITIDNGFVNEGLIDYHFDVTPKYEFFHYYQLEKLYF